MEFFETRLGLGIVIMALAVAPSGRANAEATAVSVPIIPTSYSPLSGNGQWVVGRNSEGGARWHVSGIVESIGAIEPTAVSDDGSVVVGFDAIWREGIGVAATSGAMFGVSPNGAWACGNWQGRAARWQTSDPATAYLVRNMPDVVWSAASGITNDRVVSMVVRFADGRYRAARSSFDVGVDGFVQFETPHDLNSWAWSCSANGQHFVGHTHPSGGYLGGQPGAPASFRLGGQFVPLDFLFGGVRGEARQASADGSVFAGWCLVANMGNVATMWYSEVGAVNLNELLRRSGDPVPGVEFTGVIDVSASGRTVLASSPAGTWLIRDLPRPAPCKADLSDDLRVDGIDLGLLLAVWGTPNDLGADLDASGSVDGADLGALLAAWGPCAIAG